MITEIVMFMILKVYIPMVLIIIVLIMNLEW